MKNIFVNVADLENGLNNLIAKYQKSIIKLKYSTKNHVHFLELQIHDDINTQKNFNFIILHEIEQS